MNHRYRSLWIALLAVFALITAACGNDDSSDDASPGTDTDPEAETDDTGTDSDDPDNPFLAMCPPDEAPDQIVFSIWNPHIDILEPEYEAFTELTGVEVEWLGNGTGDRITRLNVEAGNPSIDVAIVPVNEVDRLFDNDVILPADPAVPNYDNLIPLAQLEAGYGTSILQVGVGYNPDLVDPPETWVDVFTDPQYAGAISFVQLPDAASYAALAMLARELGGSEADLRPAIDLIAENRDNILMFPGASSEAEPLLTTEEVTIYPALAGPIMRFAEAGGPVDVALPGEGGPAGMNVAVVPRGVQHEGCAKAAIGWFLEEDVQLEYISGIFYGAPVEGVDAPEELEEIIFPRDPDTLVELDWSAIAADAEEILDYWSRTVIG